MKSTSFWMSMFIITCFLTIPESKKNNKTPNTKPKTIPQQTKNTRKRKQQVEFRGRERS